MIDADAVCADGVDNSTSMFGKIEVVNISETNANNAKLNVEEISLTPRGAAIVINNDEIIPGCLVTLACEAGGLQAQCSAISAAEITLKDDLDVRQWVVVGGVHIEPVVDAMGEKYGYAGDCEHDLVDPEYKGHGT